MQLVAPALGGEALLRVLPDGREEPVPRCAVPRPRDNERRLDQAGDKLVGARNVAVRADLGDRVESKSSGEDGQRRQQLALVRLEQLVAPVDRRPERLVAWLGQPAPRAQEAEPV